MNDSILAEHGRTKESLRRLRRTLLFSQVAFGVALLIIIGPYVLFPGVKVFPDPTYPVVMSLFIVASSVLLFRFKRRRMSDAILFYDTTFCAVTPPKRYSHKYTSVKKISVRKNDLMITLDEAPFRYTIRRTDFRDYDHIVSLFTTKTGKGEGLGEESL